MFNLFVLAVAMVLMMGALLFISLCYAVLLKFLNPGTSFAEIWKSI